MMAPRSLRLLFLIMLELARKYTRSLFLGFIAGLVLSAVFWRLYPYATRLIRPTQRIGMVGAYNPSTLPLVVQNLISQGLTTLDEDGTPQPALARSWEATNSGKTFMFTIRDDTTWHDGKRVSAHDINYNIRGVTFIPTGDAILTAYLQYPYSALPVLLSKPVFLPGLRGIGDYTVGNIQLSGGVVKSMILVPFRHAPLKPKQFSFFQTEAQAVLAFELGEVDELIEMSTVSALERWGRVRVEESIKYNRIVTLFFNMRDAKLQDKNIRHGLAFGIPDISYEYAGSPISSRSWAHTKNVKNYTYNPAEFKRLLKNTALASPSGELTLSTFPAYLDTAQSIAASWTNLGVLTTVRVESTVPQDFQVLLSAQDVPSDPDQYPFWHSTQSQTNVTGYSNVKIDKLLEDGRSELDQEKRKLIYADFQRRLVEDAPAIFLYYAKLYSIKRGK